MVKRKLTDAEKAICKKQIDNLKEGHDLAKGDYDHAVYKRDFLLKHNYLKMKIEVKREVRETASNLKDFETRLNDLKDQLNNGVEVKDNGNDNKTTE